MSNGTLLLGILLTLGISAGIVMSSDRYKEYRGKKECSCCCEIPAEASDKSKSTTPKSAATCEKPPERQANNS